MARHTTADIRNIAFIGHGGSGKTILTEACLLAAKRIQRLGSIADKSTVCDFEDQEKEQQRSIDTAMTFLGWKGKHLHLIDTPGYPDSIGEAISGLSAADATVLAVDASGGIKVNTRQMWKLAGEAGLPRAVVVTRADAEHARWDELLDDLKAQLGPNCLPFVVPEGGGVGAALKGVEVARRGGSEAAGAAYAALIERAVESDEELMMRYLDGEQLAPEEERTALGRAFLQGGIHPVFLVSADKGVGVVELLDAIAGFFPAPGVRPAKARDEDSGAEVEVGIDRPFTARVFKINYDPFIGKLCYLRVMSGSIEPGASVRTKRAKSAIKLGHIYSVHGKETKDVEAAVAGDIVATSKIEDLHHGDTVTSGDLRVLFPEPAYPKPMVGVAVDPKSRADDAKIGPALHKLVEADPTIHMERSAQTHELVVTGRSTLHLDTLFARLKGRYKIEVETRLPKIPYLETITGKADGHYRHKKQTGGAGQFAEVYLRVEPKPRGEGFEFASEVVGGSISSSFLPSIEKGIRQVMQDGVICGFTFVDCRVAVYDGKEHPVDSKDIAFQTAGRNAFKDAVQKAKPALLEPIANVEITAHTDHMGALMGDLNTRRGRITTTENHGELVTIKAQIPEAEMQTYSNELRSITGGEGSYTMERSHYDPVPAHLASAVISKYKASSKASSKDDE
jgi:elongation factor G